MDGWLKKARVFAGGVGLGMGLAYWLDARQGSRRRAILRDRTRHAIRRAREAAEKTAADLAGRSHRVLPALRHALRPEQVDDAVLTARVRARLGRIASRPRSLQVECRQGVVELRGKVSAREALRLPVRVRKVPGVRRVVDCLETAHPGREAERPEPSGPESVARFPGWPPGLRFTAVTLGAGLAGLGLRRGGPGGMAAAAAGLALLARGAANSTLRGLVGWGGTRPVRLQKTLDFEAPVDTVFRIWTRYGDFPRFLSQAREVIDLGEARSHWKARALPGLSAEWDAEISDLVPGKLLAWRSPPGTRVSHAGMVRFRPNGHGGTTLDVKLRYFPPGGAAGHALARLLRADPGRKLERDLLYLKDYVEREAWRLPRAFQ